MRTTRDLIYCYFRVCALRCARLLAWCLSVHVLVWWIRLYRSNVRYQTRRELSTKDPQVGIVSQFVKSEPTAQHTYPF